MVVLTSCFLDPSSAALWVLCVSNRGKRPKAKALYKEISYAVAFQNEEERTNDGSGSTVLADACCVYAG